MTSLTVPHIAEPESLAPGRLHRITRLMALAIKYDGLIRSRVLLDYSDIARLGRISKARATQIMNLLNLAPDIQERLLFLPRTTLCRDRISERHLRGAAKLVDWTEQRALFDALFGVSGHTLLPGGRRVRAAQIQHIKLALWEHPSDE